MNPDTYLTDKYVMPVLFDDGLYFLHRDNQHMTRYLEQAAEYSYHDAMLCKRRYVKMHGISIEPITRDEAIVMVVMSQ